MGSAILAEAIQTIRDFSMSKGQEPNTARVGDDFGSLVFHDGVQQKRLADAGLSRAAPDDHTRGIAGSVGGGRGGVGAEGMGGGARGDALHALVPAADGHHGREARLVSESDRGRQGRRGVFRQGTGAGRARRLELPLGGDALHVRSARLHGVGSDEPAVAAENGRGGHAGDSDGVRELDGRDARQEDAAAALDGSAVAAGGPGAEALRVDGRAGGDDVRARAGIFPDRSDVLPVAAGSDQRGADAVRGQAAQGAGARGPVFRRDRRPGDGVHVGRRDGALQGGGAGEDAAQRGGAEPV